MGGTAGRTVALGHRGPVHASCAASRPQEIHSVSNEVVIIGAGPAGLTAAYQLAKGGHASTVLEADSVVGGISRTVERDGWRFDIGGHRFFTKVERGRGPLVRDPRPDEDFLLRPRMSRIYYRGKIFDYPLRAMNALRNLGPIEAVRSASPRTSGSGSARRRTRSTFEGWVAARFGWRLYRTSSRPTPRRCGACPPRRSRPTGPRSASRTSTCSRP